MYNENRVINAYEQYGKVKDTQAKNSKQNSGSTYDDVTQTITSGLGSPLTFNTEKDEEDNRTFDQKIYDGLKNFGANLFGAPDPDRDSMLIDAYDNESLLTVPQVTESGVADYASIQQNIDSMFGTQGMNTYNDASTYDEVPSPSSNKNLTKNSILSTIKQGVAPNSTVYTIESGDTLGEIALKYGATVEDLVEVNGLEDKTGNTIVAGAQLLIPQATDMEKVKEYVKSDDVDLTDPDAQFYQSGVPMDQRIFEPELGADAQSVTGYDDVPQTLTGLMSKTDIVKKDFETVEAAQQRLNDLGYTTLVGPLATDGKLGGGTARQLRKFQKTAGISVTGKLDGATKRALKNNKFNNKEGKDRNATVVPLQDGLFEIIKAPIAKIESGNRAEPYATIGGDGMQYDGKYQFGWRAKTDLRNNPDITPAEIAKLQQMELKQFNKLSDEDKARVGPEIQTSRAAFRADSDLQEKVFRLYVDQNHETLTKNSAKYRAMDQANQLAVLGYAHNQGAENALEWLTTSVSGTDAFGTKGDKYSKAITEIFTKDDMLG